MSLHIAAEEGAIAETILLPGDPLRAQFIAENYLDEVVCYNKVRNMLGFTGLFKGKRVSVQGSGMGMPSIAIYVHELRHSYGVKKFIRVGTCGAFQEHIDLGDIIIGMAASTDSSMNKRIFQGQDFAPIADPELFCQAITIAKERKLTHHAGAIFSTDSFYQGDNHYEKNWADYGILATDMESSALYALCMKYQVKALSLLTVSDNLVTGKYISQKERESSVHEMVDLALDLI